MHDWFGAFYLAACVFGFAVLEAMRQLDARAMFSARDRIANRFDLPEDLAKAALFLASDDGAFVTGHGLNVDGGLMLRV